MAPGNIRVLGINSTESTGGRQGDYLDYDITFAPCRDQVYQLIHVSILSPALEQLYLATEPTSCNEYGDASTSIRFCQYSVDLDVSVGASLGITGGSVSAAMDLEAWDLAATPLPFANPSRYTGRDVNKRLQVVCPFDGFTPEDESIIGEPNTFLVTVRSAISQPIPSGPLLWSREKMVFFENVGQLGLKL